MGAGLSLGGVGMLGAGVLLMYSGLNDPVGGPLGALRDVLQGKTPTPGTQYVSAAYRAAGQAAGGALADAAGAVANGARGNVIAVAQKYLGVPYRLGGASSRGMDCSGLVMVAYRDGAGVKLPHKATLQMARGRRVSRSEIQPGDLVGWGVPGNYPHIALAMNAEQVIVAPTWGKTVMYQKLWEKKVPGFGYPDIVRIMGD